MSDASKQGAKGTYVWAIADYDDIFCSNTGIVCGCVESITSYWAEAFGVLSLVTFLWHMFKHFDPREEPMTVTIHCDNEAVIKTTASPLEADADVDVFLQLHQLLQDLKHCLLVEFQHVKGHQKIDQNSSREARLNH